jgi:hypothetical protein
MADNLSVTPGSGATVAADMIDGVLYQRIKSTLGADGSAADPLGGAGNVAAGVQRMTLANDDVLVALLAALIGEVQASPTSNTVLDRLKTVATSLTTLNANDFATEAKQDTIITALGSILSSTVLAAGSSIIGATKDAGPNWTTVWGVSGAPFTSSDQHSAAASVTDAPTGGQKIVLDDVVISVDTAMSATLKCETSGAVIMGPVYLPANGTFVWTSRGKGKKLATADKKLQVITSVAGNISVDAGYHSEA